MTVDPNQTNEEAVTPKSPNNKDIDSKPNNDTPETNDITPKSSNNEDKTKEKVVPTVPDSDSNLNDDDNNNEIDKTPGDPDKTNEKVIPNVIDITNDDDDDAITPKEPTGKDTPSPAEPKKEEEEEESLDVPGTMEYLARIKAYMNRPKKIKEYIDHEMKMEQVLVEEFLDKSDATKGPEIGLFMFLYFVPYSMMTQCCMWACICISVQ